MKQSERYAEIAARPPFDAFARATKLLNDFFRDMRVWSEANEASAHAAVSKDRLSATFILRLSTELPIADWSFRAEGILHQFKVTLDRMAWDLSKLHSVSPVSEKERKSIYFPLFKTASEFDSQVAASKGWLSKLEAEAVARLRKTQPFNAKDDPNGSILLWSGALENTVKHREPLRLVPTYDDMFPIYFRINEGPLLPTDRPGPARTRWLGKRHPARDGLPLVQVQSLQRIKTISVEPIPLGYFLNAESKMFDLEETFIKLHSQILASLLMCYLGFFPPKEAVLYAPGSPLRDHRDLQLRIWGSYRQDWK